MQPGVEKFAGVAFDWNDLPVGREFDCKFLKNVKSPPHALPPTPPPTPAAAGFTLIGVLVFCPIKNDGPLKAAKACNKPRSLVVDVPEHLCSSLSLTHIRTRP